MSEDTKDCTRLPVVAEELKACECGSSDSSIGYQSPQCYWVECGDCGHKTRLESSRSLAIYAWNTRSPTDAQALIAELRAELSTSNECLDMANELCAKYKARISQLQAAPAERGVVLPERRFECPMENRGDQFSWGWNACLDKFSSLNPAPVTAKPAADGERGEYGDAYKGAMEDRNIWKHRALEAEASLREADADKRNAVLATVIRCEQAGAFKTCMECGYQDGHDIICQYHESKRAALPAKAEGVAVVGSVKQYGDMYPFGYLDPKAVAEGKVKVGDKLMIADERWLTTK